MHTDDSNQPGHRHSLIRDLAVHTKKLLGRKLRIQSTAKDLIKICEVQS